ncbi:uncharacterized protein HMPREF1541_00310 [Cyphellophora europaea CBS 101466]|uniref:J domain-containing protein n=1 Tax=Cyphellophora europaea (strain CBS 101466) TaxID=1220924 RepID=W2SBL3_CYPE1|nr:uncharacterized protein HMPREF1541_00310 [Cyphellophora europaea CBS 101466]ETN46126.1 hypothetical protein HMPREF1541_00310 [Cyphellophora europaea CBS 101466]
MATKSKSVNESRSPQVSRPTPRNSRTFTSPRKPDSHTRYTDNPPPYQSKIRRSTSFTSPLELGDPSVLTQRPDRLTKNNLEALLKELDLEKTPHVPNSASSSAAGDPGPTIRQASSTARKAMPKTNFKSPKKSDKKKSKPDPDSHPLNSYIPSAAMSREDARSTPMEVDSDPPTMNGSSQPPTPSHDAPGAFPGDDPAGREEKSPTPPPHRVQPTPKVDPEACKAAGNKFFKAKDYDRAVQEYTKAVDADPSNATYLSNRAAAYISANKYDLALSDSLQANRLEPSNEKILHRLARVYTSLGRPQDALDTYSRIQNASSTDTAAARKALSSIEVAEKQIEAEDGNGNMALWSIDQAKQTLGYDTPMPRNWQVLRAKANLKIGTINALGEVQGLTQGLMRQNPNDAEAIVLAARSFYLKDEKLGGKSDYDRAEQYFRQALSLDPDNSDARTWLRTMKKLDRARNEANDMFKKGRFSDAVDMYTDAVKIDSKNRVTNAKLICNRALCRMRLKEYELARDDCDQALKLDPTYTKAKRTRAKATGESGDWEQAVKDLKALSEENAGDHDIAKELRNAELELKKSKRKDYYKILGVDKDAGDKDIERAYKKKAALYHPDKTQGDKEKEAIFKDCLEAKEILTDPQKRTMYDQGIDPNDPTSGMGAGGGGFPGGMGGAGGVQIDPEILMQMFGSQMGGGGRGGGFGGGGMPHFSFQQGGPGGMGGGRGGFPF